MLFLTLLPARTVNAGAYVFPLSFTNNQVAHKLVSWDENDIDLNPCYGWPSCYVGLDVMYSSHAPSMYSSCGLNKHCIRIENYRTRKEVMEAWRSAMGIPFSGSFTVQDSTARCVGMFYIDQPKQPAPENYTAVRFPGSVCSELPPVNQACHVELQPEIDFGVLTSDEVNNQSREVTGQLYCELTGQITLYGESLLGERNIYLDGTQRNFYANLNIDNQDASGGVKFTLPGNNIRQNFALKATLFAATPPDAGNYTGSGIVYITYL
ncbi:hypothetical protein N5923_00200 [Erwiniaceae bacterium BAC15a-03b]|uniref:Uncharacterized protein n=1 Tax=Winslowiella arboricola TaxID=2978220 RepID=A0A9J6PCM3_9GAMM|nr:hypothetical protein [Winslowiella arboricola]MCU5771607.1 hypothetical protein [Winslowiella arboricola]MCU5775921.1 hypothetical protein [Winslowiella arboricola]